MYNKRIVFTHGRLVEKVYACRYALVVIALLFIIGGAIVCCSMSIVGIGDNFMLIGAILLAGVGSWCAGCCCLKLAFQSVRDHRMALDADAARFRNASADSRQKLVVINKRFSEDTDDTSSSSIDRRRHPSEKHVNFAPPTTVTTVDVLPPPPSSFDRSISVPNA